MFFLDQICPPKIFPVETRKIEHHYHHWILHIWISLDVKFQLKLTILSFWTKFVQKRYFRSKTEEVNITVEFCIFELGLMPFFSLTKNFYILNQICPTRVFPVWNGKSEHHHWILNIWISLGAKFQLKLTILNFGTKFANIYLVYTKPYMLH